MFGGKIMIELKSNNFDAEIANGVTVVDFWAPWCGPCRMLTPTIEELSTEMTNVKFAKLNVDEAQDVAINYSVMSIPTIIIFKDGKAMESTIGVLPKATIKSKIESVL